MLSHWPFRCCSIAGWVGLWAAIAWAEAPIEYLGEAQLPGNHLDRSGLETELVAGHPANQFGGISAIEHWQGNQYLLLPDRGFGDGAVTYHTRFHRATIDVAAAQAGVIPITIDQTTLLHDLTGQPLVGRDTAVRVGPVGPTRLDPEDVRVMRVDGQEPLLAISDEYGPCVDLYGMDGRRVRESEIPARYLVATRGTEEQEQTNTTGRQTNGGFESLGITPDGSALYAVIQTPLLQDGGAEGIFNRILRIDRQTGHTQEFIYRLEAPETVICSLLFIDCHRALVLERDGKSGDESQCKKVKLVDFDGATDTAHITRLPTDPDALDPQIVPIRSQEFLNLLDFEVIREKTPKKFEGLTFGPDLPDGRKLLLVSVDNDFDIKNPTRIFAFAVSVPG